MPGAYFLTQIGIKVLKSQRKDISRLSLRRLNRENEKTGSFINHCLFIATIYVKFLELAKTDKVQFITQIEMTKDDFLPEKPFDAYISIEKNGLVVRRYFLKVIDDWLSAPSLKKIIRTYIDYSSEGDWEANTNHPFPSILFVAPGEKMKKLIFYFARNLLEEEITDLSIFVTTSSYIKANGVKRDVWQKVD